MADDRPQRVLHVAAAPYPTHQGTQVYLSGLLGAQAALGHEVTLLCWRHGRGPTPDGVRIVRTRGVPGGRRERSGPSLSRVPQAVLMVQKLRRVLAGEHFDVVHAHHVEAPLIASLNRSLMGGAKLVHHLHTSLEQELPTYLGRGQRPARWLGARLDRHLCRRADGSLAISERGAELLRSWGAQSVGCVPPGIDVQALIGDGARARRRWALGEHRWVLYSGNLDGYQDLDFMLRAMAGTDLRLLVVTGSEASALRRRCGELGLPHRVVESTDFLDTRDAMAAATVGVVPRTHCAGFPMKVLNHVGAGLPVVVLRSAVQGVPGTIEVDDMSAMVRTVGELVDRPGHAAELGAAGRAELASAWTWAVRAAQVQRFYRQIR